MDPFVAAAILTAFGAIIVAIIEGLFSLFVSGAARINRGIIQPIHRAGMRFNGFHNNECVG